MGEMTCSVAERHAMSRITVPALRSFQNGVELYQIAIPLRDFRQLSIKVEPFRIEFTEQFALGKLTRDEYLKQQGYQRSVERNRANRFATYLSSPTAISPTVLLINDRNGACTFDEEAGQLTIDTEKALYIYDGQHRKDGYLLALSQKRELAGFPVFAVITGNVSKRVEMEQFRVINGTQKGVKTNLVIEIMTLIDPNAETVDLKEAKKIACNHAMHECNDSDDSPWSGVIIAANQAKVKKSEINSDPTLEGKRLLGSRSFIDSLTSVYDFLNQMGFKGIATNKAQERGAVIAEIVIEYWDAIKTLMPEPFENPSKYMLQESAAAIVALHKILVYLMSVMYEARRDWSAKEFQVMLQDCDWFTQSDYWEKGYRHGDHYVEGGEASVFSGGGGGAEKLYQKILESLRDSARKPVAV
jgi:DGQHR domain-containing protein